ncbi:MAG TPA: PaaI family thioesterase [Candidatus Eisenbacteria bacterium]|jgi:1,4-dihydroxy-2-naphthoyl-CoA hydrolase|nr:PaaI family thioesterase [Candidatus Eisenbacteria bacterium]
MSQDFSARMNELPEGWLKAMGVTITLATQDEVRCELTVGPEHLQGYGIVHGGVHCGLIESLASIGAALVAMPRKQTVVGLENNTSFVRAVRAGARLHAVATPVTRGRRTQVWEARVLDEQDQIVATGRVRLLCLEPDQALAGEQVKGVLHPETK